MHPLYKAAIDADKAFTDNLVRQFGGTAGTKRYQPGSYDTATHAAWVEFHRAMEAWLPVARTMLVHKEK